MAAQPIPGADSPVALPTRNTSGAALAPTPSPLHVPASRAEGRNLADRAPSPALTSRRRVPPAVPGARIPSGARSAGQHLELVVSGLLLLVLAVAGAAAAVALDRHLDAQDEARAGVIGLRAAAFGFEGEL